MDLLVATHNAGKLREFEEILSKHAVVVRALPENSLVPVESSETLYGNALIKAESAFETFHLPCVADDSGLFVDELEFAPGVHSARFAGLDADDAKNRNLLLEKMASVVPSRRTASFRCVICLIAPDHFLEPQFYLGVLSGTIAQEPRGNMGFGYDSIFIPSEGDGRTFAEMAPSEKNAISHRARALWALAAALAN